MKRSLFTRIRDWKRGFTDDDVVSATEKMIHGRPDPNLSADGARYIVTGELSKGERRAAQTFPDVAFVSRISKDWLAVWERRA